MLAALHASPPSVRGVFAAGWSSDRRHLEDARGALDRPWADGPLSEIARRALAAPAEMAAGWLADVHGFADRLGAADAVEVVTHGAPHPGNVIHGRAGPVLVDRDTVALARPERDRWMSTACATATLVAEYGEITGITPEPDALEAYRLLQGLTDLTRCTRQLRDADPQDADGEHALSSVPGIRAEREPSPHGVTMP